MERFLNPRMRPWLRRLRRTLVSAIVPAISATVRCGGAAPPVPCLSSGQVVVCSARRRVRRWWRSPATAVKMGAFMPPVVDACCCADRRGRHCGHLNLRPSVCSSSSACPEFPAMPAESSSRAPNTRLPTPPSLHASSAGLARRLTSAEPLLVRICRWMGPLATSNQLEPARVRGEMKEDALLSRTGANRFSRRRSFPHGSAGGDQATSELIRVAEESNADLIAMSTHGSPFHGCRRGFEAPP